MTLGKKIACGFGALIAIATLLGGLSVFTMKTAQSAAQTLATEYVPEAQVASALGDAIAVAQLAVRSYGLTGEPGYLETARKGLEEVHKQVEAAQKLSDAHPDLVKLSEHLKELAPSLKEYEDLVAQTETKNKAILATLNTYPRDALLHASADELYPIVERIATLGERRQVRVFCHRDPWHRFVNCLVYLPRDRYTTATAERIQQLLSERFGGVAVEHSALVTESVMTRLDVVVRLGDGAPADVDLETLEDELTEATRTWDERFIDHVYEWPSERRGVDFPDSYKGAFTPQQGVEDLEMLNRLTGSDEMRAAILDTGAEDAADLRLRLYRRSRIALPDVLPHLDHLGVSVIDEWPFELSLRGEPAWVYEFGLRSASRTWKPADRGRFIDAFQASITGALEVGPMNALVTSAGLTWDEVGRLRAMERYLKQGAMTYSYSYIANALLAHPELASQLVAAFRVAHDPDQPGSVEEHRDAAEALLASVESALDQVSNLDQDRIIRAFVALQRAQHGID